MTADYFMYVHTVWLTLVQGYVLTLIYSYAHDEIYQGVYSYCCVIRVARSPRVSRQEFIVRKLVNHDTLQQVARILYAIQLLQEPFWS